MAIVSITGTIQRADGIGVEGVSVRLSPMGRSTNSPAVISGIGILLDPIESLTASDGTFSIDAVQGFTYVLEIPALGYKETFIAPAMSSISFHLLGLVPQIQQVQQFTDDNDVETALIQIRVERLGTVLERFDTIVVESADEIAGTWSRVALITIVASIETYEITDLNPTQYYRARYIDYDHLEVAGDVPGPIAVVGIATTDSLDSVIADEVTDLTSEFTISAVDQIDNTGGTDTTGMSLDVAWIGDQGENSQTIQSDAFRETLVLSISEFQQIYLFGLDLTDGDGNPYPQEMYDHYIKAAIAWVEHELDISITPKDVVDEDHDHYSQDYGNWGYFQLYQYPVQHVDRVAFQYPTQTEAVEINLDWVVLCENGAHGVIQIVPGQGNIADVLLIPGSLMPLWSGAYGRVPGIWKISYRTGFEPNEIPEDIKYLVGIVASIGILNVAGDLVGGSGLQGWTTSVPGLSQAITTTNSSTNAGFGARIIDYRRELKRLLPTLMGFYGKTTKMVVA